MAIHICPFHTEVYLPSHFLILLLIVRGYTAICYSLTHCLLGITFISPLRKCIGNRLSHLFHLCFILFHFCLLPLCPSISRSCFIFALLLQAFILFFLGYSFHLYVHEYCLDFMCWSEFFLPHLTFTVLLYIFYYFFTFPTSC